MADLRKLKDKAADLAERGKLDKAASVYADVLEEEPDDVSTRQKRADVLRRAGRLEDAIAEYSIVAERFGKDGLLIKAIAICKTILELDAQHVETQSALAGLYAARATTEATRPPRRATLFMAAVRAPEPAPPAPDPEPDSQDTVVSFKLKGTPPPPEEPERGFPQPVMKFIPPPGPAVPPPVPTPLARISLAAVQAVEDGVVEDIEIEDLAPDVVEEGFELVAEPQPAAATAASPDEGVIVEVEAPGADGSAAAVREPDPFMVSAQADEPLTPASHDEAAEARAAAEAAQPDLPHIPIFSDLSREAFLELTAGMVLHRYGKGAVVLREGDEGTSFFVLASGRLSVTKRDDRGNVIPLARLGDGDFFGEMAILSGAPRAASLTAEEQSEVLEFPAQVLLDIARRHPHVATSLRRFYRQRLLANAMAVSPVFRPFGKGDRKLIMERFLAREVRPGDVVVREGERSDGLYVVLEGAVEVRKLRDGAEVVVGQLREGDLFGEMSCLRKSPASATVVVKRAGTLLRLPRKDFDELVLTYPQILELVSELSDERLESLDAILSGHAEWTDEGLVLV
jgi:CRP-like cAMP-binding protein/tetratricopeptide (TPR) repeat protein